MQALLLHFLPEVPVIFTREYYCFKVQINQLMFSIKPAVSPQCNVSAWYLFSNPGDQLFLAHQSQAQALARQRPADI